MAIKIGHASIDEKGKVKDGISGDQTTKEVCTRLWYNKPWSFVLRPRNINIAEKIALSCEKGCANNNIGYDQNQRNTLNIQASKVGYDLSSVQTKCETDCSAFMTVCCQAAGINIPYNSNNAPTTSTMQNVFSSTGYFDVLTESKYLTSDKYLKRGDILVKPGSHTIMALENGSMSTSNDINTSPPISKGNAHLRDLQSAINLDKIDSLITDGIWGVKSKNAVQKCLVKNGSKGNVTAWIQCRVGVPIDGVSGAKTVTAIKSYQSKKGLAVDGCAGYNTIISILKDYGVTC